MPKVGFEGLVHAAGLQAAQDRIAQSSLAEAQLQARRVRLECGDAGTSILLSMARIDSVVDGIPSTIPLGSPNGYCSGLTAVREDGRWRLGGTPESIDAARHGMPMSQMFAVISHVLDALGHAENQHVRELLDRAVRWSFDPDSFARALDAAFPLLPDHVVRSVVANSTRVLFGASASLDRDVHRVILVNRAWGQTALFQPDECEVKAGVPGILVRAAAAGDRVVVANLASFHARPPGTQGPSRTEMNKALQEAAVSTRGDTCSMIGCLISEGADPLVLNVRGGTLLHDVAASVDTVSTFTVATQLKISRKLIEAGVDKHLLDRDGRDAAGILEEQIGRIERQTGRRPDSADEFLALLGDAPAPRFR